MERDITINGINVHYRQVGKGEPIILMHGWGCDSSTMSLFERVGLERHEVFNIDLPGFGKSDEPPTPWTVEDYTRMLEEFVKLNAIKNPILLGHSFGGRVAILYASRNAVNKLILVDAAGIKPSRSLKYYAKVYSYKMARRLYPLILGREKAAAKIEQKRGKSGSSDYRNASPMMRQVLVKAVNNDLSGVMKRIDAPTLLMWGENDTATPIADARKMKRLIPRAGLVTFAGAGHFSFLDNPYASAATMRRFILGNPEHK